MAILRLSHTAGTDLRKVVALAVPSIITNITTPLLGLVDLAVTGHISDGPDGKGALYIAAIAAGSSVFTMMYWLFAFLRMGTGGITAQASGAGDRHAVDLALSRSLLLALTVGTAITLLGRPIGSLMLRFIDPDPPTLPIAMRYVAILAWGAPAMLATFSLTGWFIGRQDTRSPMWVSIAVNVVNIALSLFLVMGLGMRIEGVAIGTLTAQWTGFVISMAICLRKYSPTRPALKELLAPSALRRYFSVNTDIFLRTLCMVAVTVWFTRSGARQGDVMLAVNALLMQLFLTFSYFMDGFAFAGESLTGLYYGAGDRASLRRVSHILLGCGGSMAFIFTILYFIGGEWFLGIMSNDARIAQASSDYFLWAVSVPLIGFTAFSLDAVAIGVTATRSMLASALAGAAIFFGVYLLAFPAMGNHGLWLAFILYLAARGLSLAILLRLKLRPA
ncbi:MAG: MATE family efflux transporter [Alloprevotella sp.]|nr:MATE family efflux transporter [Alloprevotella sp.]